VNQNSRTQEIEAGFNADVLGIFKDFPGAFLTGSRVFGWANQDSDYDVCIRMEDKGRAFAAVEAYSTSYKESQYFDSAKGAGCKIHTTVQGREFYRLVTINPIPLHPLDMLCWWLATREIRHLATIDATRAGNREFKHGAFEMLRGFYKTMIRYEGAEVAHRQLLKDQAIARREDAA